MRLFDPTAEIPSPDGIADRVQTDHAPFIRELRR